MVPCSDQQSHVDFSFLQSGVVKGADRENLVHQGAGQTTEKENGHLAWRNGFSEKSAEALWTCSVGEINVE